MTDTKTTTDPLMAAENYTRDVLRIFGQHDDAANDRLVRQIARKVLRAMPLWTHPQSPLRSVINDGKP